MSAKNVKEGAANNSKQNKCPDWLDGKSANILNTQNKGDEKTTAQVSMIWLIEILSNTYCLTKYSIFLLIPYVLFLFFSKDAPNIHIVFLLLFVQVHPYKLTKALYESARSRGVQLVTGKVGGIESEERNGNTVVKGKNRFLSITWSLTSNIITLRRPH